MNLLVTGVTRTGNLGGAAMLKALEDVVGDEVDDLTLVSIVPDRDAAQDGPDGAHIAWGDYRYWLLVVAPLCILLWPVRRLRAVRALASRIPIFRDFARADAVADLSGIAFVDGRGLALLYYNVAVVLPGLFFDVPVYKLSQALGPFRRPLNRRLAAWTLSRCRVVVARGSISLAHLEELGIGKGVHFPDTSFAIEIPDSLRADARDQIARAGLREQGELLVLMSPSAVVARCCQREGRDMVEILAKAIVELGRRGVRLVLIAHSTDTGIAKNDDLSVIAKLEEKVAGLGLEVKRLDPKGDPRLARALIGEADVFVASRFHSLIAALSQAVPVITIGWSHKYAEAAEPFGMGRYTIDYAELEAGRLVKLVEELAAEGPSLRPGMEEAAKNAHNGALAGIRIILQREKS